MDEVLDEVVTHLYRRFKEWSKRGFTADDVTWCEVRADVAVAIEAAIAQAEADERARERAAVVAWLKAIDWDSESRSYGRDFAKRIEAGDHRQEASNG